ncbi:hypothetical protein MNBD_PLANCTO03-2164, partial [hydrothermal vent metagenome]
MFHRSSRRVSSLLAAAAACAGVQGVVVATASAQQATLPTIAQELTAPSAVIDRAQ